MRRHSRPSSAANATLQPGKVEDDRCNVAPLGSLRHTSLALKAPQISIASKKRDGINVQGFRELFKSIDCRCVLLSFNHSNVVAIKARQIGKLFLRQAALPPNPPEILSHHSPQFHAARRP
jgi:hypothetical protein